MTTRNTLTKPEYQTIRKPSAALTAFIAEARQHAIDSLSKKIVCEALAEDLVEDDLRMTQFSVRYREPNRHSPAGTLIVTHDEFPDSVSVVITSVEADFTHEHKEVPRTLWSVFHPMKTDILTVTEERGCLVALQEASNQLKKDRNKHTGRLQKTTRMIKHGIFG